MTKMYKLVTQEYTTHGGMKWEIGKTNKATHEGIEMCSNQVLHCYKTPEQAVLFNPVHVNIQNPILLEISCSDIVANDGLKYACKEQTPVREVVLPKLTTNQVVAIAIKLACLVYESSEFIVWANNWLSGRDRTARAADAAADAAYAAADAARAADAAYAAAYAAADAAYAARSARGAADAKFSGNLQEVIIWVMGNIT